MAFPADSMWCRCGGVGSHRRRPWCESAHVVAAMVSIILLMASQHADGFRMGSAQVLPDRVNAEAKEGRQVYADTAAWSDTHQKLAGVQADFTSSDLPTDNPLSPKEVSEDADQSDRHKTQQLARGRSDDLGEEDSQVVDDDLYPFINKKKATTFFWQQPSVSKRRQWFKKLQKMRDDDTFDDEDEDNGDDEHGDDSSLRDKLGLADKGDKGDDFDNTSDDGDNHSSESDDIESDEKDVDDEKTGSLEDEEDDESNDADEYHDEDYDAGSYDKDGDSEFDNDDHAVNDDDEERVGHYHESWSKYVDKGDQRTSSSDNKELTDSSSSSNSSKSKEDETGGSGSNSSSGIESDEVSYNISSSSSNNSSSDSSRVLYNDNDDASKQQLHKWNRRRWKGHSNTKQQMNAQQQPSKQRPTTHKHPQHIRKHPQSRVRLYRKKLQQQQQRRRRRQHLRRWHHHHRRQIHRQRAATLGEERNGQPKSTEHKQEAATTDKPPAPSAHWLHRWQPVRKIHWRPSRRRQVARKAYSKCSERKPFPQKITGHWDKIIMPRRRKKGSPPLKQKCNGKRRRNKAKGPKTAPKIPVVWNKGGTGHNTKNGTVVSQTGHENATLAYNASQKLPDSLMENNGTLPDTGFQGNASAALSSEHNDTGFHSDLLIANRSSDGLFPPKGEDSLGSLVPISTVYLGSVKGQKIHTARLDVFTHTSGSQATTSNETPLYLRVQYKSSKDGEPNSNSKEDIFPLLRAERKGPRDKIRKRQKREWKNPHEKSDSLEQSSASGSNRKPSTDDDDGGLSSKPDRLTLKYIVPIVQYIELMQAEANHKAPYLTDSEDDFPGASSSDNETSILRRNRRNIDDDGDDDNTDDDVDDVAGNNSDEMDNPVAAPGNDDDDNDDDDDEDDDDDDDDDDSRRVSNRRQWRRRHRISRALDDDDDDDDDDNDGDASSHRRSHGRRWLTHGRRHRENDDDNDDNDEDRSYSRHHGQQRYNNRRRSRGNNGDDNNDDDDNDNDDVRSSGSSSRRWHQSRPTHRRHSSNRNNDDDVNDDDNNDDDDVRRRQGRQNGRRRHYNDANDDDDDNDNNDDTETLRNVDRRNRYRHDQGRQGMRRHRNRNGDDNDDDNDDDDGDRRHRLRDRYRLRAQSSIPRSNNNDDNNNNDDDDNDRLRRYERRNMRQGRRIRTYDTMQADDGDVGDDNRGGSAVTSLGFVQINNDDEEGEQSQDTSLSHRHRAENTNSNRRRTEGRRNPRRERTQRRRENRMEQRRERGNGRRNRNRTTPLPIEVSIGDATKNADSRGGDITSNDRTAVDVRARTTAVVAASDDEVDAVRVSVRGGSDDGSPRSPPIPQIRAISNNNGNNGNGDGGTAPEAHIRSPFINHRTAYDFLSSQAVRPGQGRAGSRANNEQRAEQFQFAHTMSESLCEVFDKHFVPTAAGGRCE